MTSMSNEPTGGGASRETTAAAPAPVVIDLGKKSRKRIKALRKGKPGALLDKIREAVGALQEQGTISASAQTVIVVVRERQRKPALFGG